MFYAHNPILIICDSGATSSLIRHSLAVELDMNISPTGHSASQADGKTRMTSRGEVHVILTRNDLKFNLQVLVIEELDCDVLAGVPFMCTHGIVLDLPNDEIIIAGKYHVPYSASHKANAPHAIRRSQSFMLKATTMQVVFPAEYIELQSLCK